MAEKKLTAHDNLIIMVIKRQAGTVAKAVLEGVMNSIDAGADKVQVSITNSKVVIEDNGKGFTSEQEVDDYFAEFGNPHSLDEEGCATDAKYGTFRIGRGQLFAFGANRWHTNNIDMRIDIDGKNKGRSLEFDYEEVEDRYPGCKVEVNLYEVLTGRDLAECIRDVERYCKYVDVDLHVNGDKVNKAPGTVKWDKQDDFAYVRIKPDTDTHSGVEIYQQGVYVETIPGYVYGISGVVVTRVPVKLNLARNQVIRSCSKWKKITKLLTHESRKKTSKKKTGFSESEKMSITRQYLDGTMGLDDFFVMCVFSDVTGKDWSLSTLKRAAAANSKFELTPDKKLRIAFSPVFDNMGDKAMQCYKGVVLANSCVHDLGFRDFEHLKECIESGVCDKSSYRCRSPFEFTTVKDMMQGEDARYTLIKDPTPTENIILDGLTSLSYNMERATGVTSGDWRSRQNRVLRLGDSTCADGWTDGKTFVAVDRKFLAQHTPLTPTSCVYVIQLYLHELCHNTPDTEGHGHDIEFYKRYHDESRHVPKWALSLFDFYVKRLRAADRKIPKRVKQHMATMGEADALQQNQEKAAELTTTN